MTTEALTRTIDPDEAEALFHNANGVDVGAWCREGDLYDEKGRWMEYRTLVLRHDDGTVWGLPYGRGLTEQQEHEFPWRDGDGPVELTRLWRTEEITVRYVGTQPDHTASDDLTDRIYDTLLAALGEYNVIHCAVTETGPINGIEAAGVEDIAAKVARVVRGLTR